MVIDTWYSPGCPLVKGDAVPVLRLFNLFPLFITISGVSRKLFTRRLEGLVEIQAVVLQPDADTLFSLNSHQDKSEKPVVALTFAIPVCRGVCPII